ncbi:MAG: polymer-forming cytoskeletal protein [Methylacidiphilales bacterium]|nr:polymer-forming cytoskeletal protein [Candidatus Methylacidiphilales bacterium]MDW8349050.1 polymer-forming cytoskeletal protein [Verrucomicrobiae bacterium]
MAKEEDNKKRTIISRGIIVKGEIEGNEPLTIEGKVEGTISLQEHIHVAVDGEVNAQISTKSIVIAGSVSGNIKATERVELLACGSMIGDIQAPNVILSDGCIFRGKIDMDIDESKIEERRRSSASRMNANTSVNGIGAALSAGGTDTEGTARIHSEEKPKVTSTFLRQI